LETGTHKQQGKSIMKIRNLTDLFIHELRDIYNAEHQLREALPEMAKLARNADLKKAFEQHNLETQRHVTRIEEFFDILGLPKKRETCKAMAGLLAEGRVIIDDAGDDRAIDSALIAAAQKIEHYEIASYGTLIALARTLGYDNAVVLLKETLMEEKDADEKLTHLATDEGINQKAVKKAA
jgi:ferritin-like metal-binding protein YciE